MARARATVVLALAGIASVALSGCVGGADRPASPGELRLAVSWEDAQHLNVNVKNVGGSPLSLSGMDNMQVTGPEGTMPLHWNGMAPTLMPGEARIFDLHSMHMADGTMGMTMDHAMAGSHMAMPPGDYMLRIGEKTAMATLEG